MFIVKNWIEFDYVSMVHIRLYFYLFDELLDNVLFLYLRFLYHFQAKNHSCFFMSIYDETYLAIFTLPNLPLPKSLPSSKSEIPICFKFFRDTEVDMVYFRSFYLVGSWGIFYFSFPFFKKSISLNYIIYMKNHRKKSSGCVTLQLNYNKYVFM